MKRLPIILILTLLIGTAWARNTGDVYHEVQVVDEVGANVTTISSVEIYAPDTTTNAVIYKDRNRQNAITIPMTTGSTNTTLSNGRFNWYGPDGYDFSITDGTNIATNADHRTRTSSESVIVFPTYLTSISSTTYSNTQSATFGTSGDWVLSAGAVADTFTAIPATTSTSTFNIGSASFTGDFRTFGDGGFHVIWDASEATLELLDNVTLAVGTGDDYTITHNGTTTTIAGAHTTSGIVTQTGDILFDGTAADIRWDASEDTIGVLDNAVIGFGNTAAAPDVEMTWDTDSFNITAVTTDVPWELGDTTNGFDMTYFFETAGQFRTDFDGDFINLTDDMDLRFGTGASSDGDFQISSSSANLLTIGQIVAGTGSVAVGVDDAGLDWTFYGDTTAIFSMWDTSANVWHYEGQAVVFEFEGATADGSETTLSVTDPTADVVYTLADAGAGTYSLMSSTLATNAPEVANSVTGGTNQLIFEGTVDAHEHVVTATDATADVVWTLADGGASTVSVMASTLATNFPEIANSVTGGTNQLIFEGTVDGFETILTATDATADATLTLPDDSGDVVYAPAGAVDYAAGAGALPLTHVLITYESTGGAEALTLANGKDGQVIVITHDTDGGNGVVTPATAAGWTSIDLADAGDTVALLYVNTAGWALLGTSGNAAPPVVTP